MSNFLLYNNMVFDGEYLTYSGKVYARYWIAMNFRRNGYTLAMTNNSRAEKTYSVPLLSTAIAIIESIENGGYFGEALT